MIRLEEKFNSYYKRLEEGLLYEGTKYDTKAVTVLIDSGLFNEETSKKIIDGLFRHDIHAFVHSPAWLEKYLVGIARMIVEEAYGDPRNASQFIQNSIDVFEYYLEYVKSERPKLSSDKERIKFDDKFIKEMSYQDVVNIVKQIKDKLNAESHERLKTQKFNNKGYSIIKIDSYEQMHSMFGGRLTGDGESDNYAGNGGTAWCHANDPVTYSNWVKDNNVFFVLARDNWKDIPFNPDTNAVNAKDDYGTSLIAILVDGVYGDLLHATLRSNHVGLLHGSADNQYPTYADLAEVTGLDVEKYVLNVLKITNPKEVLDKCKVIDNDEFIIYLSTTEKEFKLLSKNTWWVNEEGYNDIYPPDDSYYVVVDKNNNKKYLITDNKGISIVDDADNALTMNFLWKNKFLYDFFKEKYPKFIYSQDECKNFILKPDSEFNVFKGIYRYIENLTIDGLLEDMDYNMFIFWSTCFSGMKNLKTLKINDNISRLPPSIFAECSELINVQLPDSIETIEIGAFSNCANLKSINLLNVKHIDSHAFANCYNLDANISPKIEYIGERAFDNTNLSKVKITKSLTKIDDYAFMNCENIKEVWVDNFNVDMKRTAFIGATNISKLYVPGTKKEGVMGVDNINTWHKITNAICGSSKSAHNEGVQVKSSITDEYFGCIKRKKA